MAQTLPKRLSASLEDYLEAICFELAQSQVARVRDIARRLDVAAPSVTAALKNLASRGLLNYEPYGYVTLTPRGQAQAKRIVRRHEILRRFMTDLLCLDEQDAQANACRIEHAVDDRALDRLSLFARYLQEHPAFKSDWNETFLEFCRRSDADGAEPDLPPDDNQAEQPTALGGNPFIEPGPPRRASHDGPPIPLSQTCTGQTVELAEIRSGRELRHRLAEMGLVPGVRFRIVQPGRPGPFIIQLKAGRLVLGHGMIHRVLVYSVSD